MAGEALGVIGTGRMGGPMAGRLMDAGYSLVIYDTQSEAMQPLLERGAQQAKSPADVASRAEIVLASLPTPDIVKTVALGADGISSGNMARIVIDLSTTGPGAAKLVAEGLKAKRHDAGRCSRQRRHQGRRRRHARGHGVVPGSDL